MKRCVLLLDVCCLSLVLFSAHGYNLRRPASYNDDTDAGDLSAALRVLERERRRLEDELYYKELLREGPVPGYYDWLREAESQDDVDRYYPPSGAPIYKFENTDDDNYIDTNEFREKSKEIIPSKEELENIFDSDKISIDTNSVDDANNENILDVISTDDRDIEDESNQPDVIDVKNLTEDQIKIVLSKIEELEKSNKEENDVTENNIHTIASEPLSKAELEDVFNQMESKITSDSEPKMIDSESTSLGSQNEETFEPYLSTNNAIRLGDDDDDMGNSKRLTKRDNRQEGGGSEVAYLKELLAKTRLIEVLEDKENDFLSNALSLATLSQVKHSSSYLPGQFQSLQKAIRIEEILQTLSNTGGTDDKIYLDKLVEDYIQKLKSEAEKLDQKRSEQNYLEESNDFEEPWIDTDLEDESSEIPYEETEPDYLPDEMEEEEEEADLERQNAEANMLMEQLYGRYEDNPVLLDDGFYGDTEGPDEEDIEEEYALSLPPAQEVEISNEPLMEFEADDIDDYTPEQSYRDIISRLNEEENQEETSDKVEETLRRFLHNLDPWQRSKLESKLESYADQTESSDEYQEEAEEDYICPNLEVLSTNCRFADMLGAPMDDEAREMCNRHELCYTCGTTSGFSREHCDAGYTADVLQLCKDDQCVEQAETFLKLMRLVHKYDKSDIAECAVPCVANYIYGL